MEVAPMLAPFRAIRPQTTRAGVLPARVWVCSALLLVSCDARAPTAAGHCPAGKWAYDSYGVRDWPHDCEPWIGTHFTVYSDASSQEARVALADVAEEVLEELSCEFEIQSEAELGLTGGYRYYAYAQGDDLPGVAEGYRNGFLMPAVDRGPPPGAYYRHPTQYRRTVKHELTHVLQFTLIDCSRNDCPSWLEMWFVEGQAVYMSQSHPIPTLASYRTWVADPTHVNPLTIRVRQDLPDPDRLTEYYSMFGLAVAYLMDGTRGLGATIADCRRLFQLLDEGDPFEVAFRRAFAVTVSQLRDNFFDLMEEYLGGAP